MELVIKITGPAWLWMNSTADIISGIFSELWYHVAGDNEYQSLIKGWFNWFDLNISSDRVAISKTTDVVIAFNAANLENVLPSLKKGGYIVVNKKFSDKLAWKLDDYVVLDRDIVDKYDNTYLLAMLSKLLGLEQQLILDKVGHVFWKKSEILAKMNQKIVSDIYADFEVPVSNLATVEKIWEPRKITYWNKAFAYGAMDGELEYYSAYPMTPASTILSEVVNSGKVTFLQAEDEIAVANSVLWASFTGKRAMCGTSGGWFALMTEALSFAIQAEIPAVVAFSQRAGPSTGTPTFHEAGDINFALNPTFGDFNHVVMTPSSLEEAYYYGCLALNIAQKYQMIVIVLLDKQSSEFHGTIWEEKIPEVDRGKLEKNPKPDYKRYAFSDDNISPYTTVWTKDGDFIATSYEHDEYGATTEESEMKMKMNIKRFHKLDNFFEKEGYRGYEVINPDAKKVFICNSFTSYNVKDFIKHNPEYGLIIIKFLKPLDEKLTDEVTGKDEIIFLESNYSGQMEKYICNELGWRFIDGLTISHKRKHDLYPFYMEDFDEFKTK